MRLIVKCAFMGLVAFSLGAMADVVAAPSQDPLEMLAWSDPERAAKLIDADILAQGDAHVSVQTLEVRSMVYADMHRDAEVDATVVRLQEMARRGMAPAAVAAGYVRAYSLYQRDQFAAANVELMPINIEAIKLVAERYRVSILRGNALRMLGRAEAALPWLERGLDIAREMHDDVRVLHATLWLARIFLNTGNVERAAQQLDTAQRLAAVLGDETALVEIDVCRSDIADRRADHAEERRASLAALGHAKNAGSSKWLAHALINLGDSYLKTHDYAESLKYSKQALPMAMRLRASGDEPIILSNEGMAYIGLGNIKLGEKLVDEAIDKALAGENILDARELLREYADALEHAGYLMMAIQTYHRYDAVSEKAMTITRQRAFLELSAKFDDERKARELELLRRDNELKASEMVGQRLRQQLIVAAALCVTCICGALIWAVARVRKANERLRFSSERDALTGLHNRRYFNDNVLAVEGARPVGGCVLLADLDHFKRINDSLGHPAGDAVLTSISQRLAAALREQDKLVRWGGEEFLAVLDSISPEQANTTVERLLEAVRRDPVVWNGEAIHCTMSIGYACFPMQESAAAISLDSAISLVDKALYEAKRRGRDRACLIGAVIARSDQEFTVISAEFECAAADRRIRLVDTGVAA